MSKEENGQRASRIGTACGDEYLFNPAVDSVVDMLTDLRHWCDANLEESGTDPFDRCVKTSRLHYEAEIEESRDDQDKQ